MKPKVAISVGDINGIGLQIALRSHKEISKICSPVYFVDKNILRQASKLLHIKIPKNFKIFPLGTKSKIIPSTPTRQSGRYSFLSFKKALKYTKAKKAKALVTLPINKNAWNKAGIKYKGHTELLRAEFNKNAIMMMGVEELFVALLRNKKRK